MTNSFKGIHGREILEKTISEFKDRVLDGALRVVSKRKIRRDIRSIENLIKEEYTIPITDQKRAFEVLDSIENTLDQAIILEERGLSKFKRSIVYEHILLNTMNDLENIVLSEKMDKFTEDVFLTLDGLSAYNGLRFALYNSNQALIRKTMENLGVKSDAFLQEAQDGLMRAVTCFEVSKGFGFSTYAYTAIKKALKKAESRRNFSLNKKIGRGEGIEAIKLIKEDPEKSYRNINRIEIKESIEAMARFLPERLKKIIKKRYGFDGKGERTYKEIGEELGMTDERARQLGKQAIKKLSRTPYIDDFDYMNSDKKDTEKKVEKEKRLQAEINVADLTPKQTAEKRKRISKLERVARIKNLVNQEFEDNQISGIEGIKSETVAKYRYNHKVKSLISSVVTEAHRISQLREISRENNGLITYKQAGEVLGGLAERTVRWYSKEGNISLLSETQYEKLRKKFIRNIIGMVLKNVVEKDLDERKRWAYGKVVEFEEKKDLKSPCLSFNDLFELFERVNDVRAGVRDLTSQELVEGLGISYDSARRSIFQKVGLKPPYSTQKSRLGLKLEQATERSFYIPMSISDISYFLQAPYNSIYNRFQRFINEGRKRVKVNPYIVDFNHSPAEFYEGTENKLDYKSASQIFMFYDKGFNPKQIAIQPHRNRISTLSDKSLDVVNYTISHRSEIEPVIIEALKILYPKEKITKPYMPITIQRDF